MSLLRDKDPIVRLRNLLISEQNIAENDLDIIENKAKQEVDAAYQFARSSNYPNPEDALNDLYVS